MRPRFAKGTFIVGALTGAAPGTQTEMGFKLINLKQCLVLVVVLVGIILLVGTIRHEQKPPTATGKSHFTTPILTYARMALPQPATNSGFLDNINLSFDPQVKIHDPDPYLARLNFQSDLPSGSFAQLPRRSGNATKSAFTVVNRELDYELFGSEGFAFKLNLKPGYSYPEALIPTRLDPGLDISIKF